MPDFYAGIGSRKTPTHIQEQEDRIAQKLRGRGWWLRSGGAKGSDTAFEYGAGGQKRIYYKEEATCASMEFASRFHKAWRKCNFDARQLLGRNPFQILGDHMQGPKSKFVCCYTEDGQASGGTGLAIRVAMWAGIPVFNLHDETAESRLWRWLDEQGI